VQYKNDAYESPKNHDEGEEDDDDNDESAAMKTVVAGSLLCAQTAATEVINRQVYSSGSV